MRLLHSLLLFLCLAICTPAYSQCVGAYFSNQSQIDTFLQSTGCTELSGDLSISNGPSDPITDLSPLAGLTSVGALLIYNTSITDLSGLESITSIEGPVRIANNANLVSLNGIQNAQGITSIFLEDNDVLEDISAFGNLTSLSSTNQDHGLIVRNCMALQSLQGLHNITDVGSYTWIEHNHALTDLMGLKSLATVGNTMWINDNDLLTDMSGLESLTQVWRLGIVEHENLTSLEGLESLKTIDDGFVIENNPNLASLQGLNSLETISRDPDISTQRGLLLKWLPALNSFEGLESLTAIHGDLYVWSSGITSMEGLNNLQTVDRNFYLSNNTSLTSLADLESLQNIGSFIRIIINYSLSDCAIEYFCENLESIPDKNIIIHSNGAGCRNEAEILTACDAKDKARVIDANPTFYGGLISEAQTVRDISIEDLYNNASFRDGLAADGVTEVVVFTEFEEEGEVEFSIDGVKLEQPWGKQTVEIEGKHMAFAYYTAPDTFPQLPSADQFFWHFRSSRRN